MFEKAKTFVAGHWQRSALLRGTSILVGGTLTAQIVNLLVSPILTRLYDSSQFGTLGVYNSIIALVGVIAALRYEMAIPLPEKEKNAYHLLILSFVIVVFMSLVTAVVFFAFGSFLLPLLQAEALEPYLWLLPFGVLGFGAYHSLNLWAIRKKAYPRIARTRLTQAIGQAAVQLAGGVLQLGPIGLLAGHWVGRSAGSFSLAALVWGPKLANPEPGSRKISLRRLLHVANRYRRFPLLSSEAAVLNALGLQLPLLLLSSWYGAQVAGWYFLAMRIMGIPSTIIGQALSKAYTSESADIRRSNPLDTTIRKQYNLLRKMVQMAFLVGLPFLVVGLLGPWLFPFVFGEGWYEAGLFAQPMAFMFLMRFISSPTGGTLDVLERQDLHLLREVVRLVLMSGAIVLAGIMQSTPLMAVTYFSVAGVLSYFFYLLTSIYAIKVHGRRSRRATAENG